MQSQHKKPSKMEKFREKIGLTSKRSKDRVESSASRAPSPAPSFANTATTEGKTKRNGTSIDAHADPGATVAMPIGSLALVTDDKLEASPFTVVGSFADAGSSDLPAYDDGYVQAIPGSAPSFDATDSTHSSKAKEGLRTAWHGFTMFLGKFEGLLAGTPFKTPVAAVNVLIQLQKLIFVEAVSDNKDLLRRQIDGLQRRLQVLQEALMSDTDGVSMKMKEDFARLLMTHVIKLHEMSNQTLWKAILENEEDRTKLRNIVWDIDEHTKNFHLQVVLNIERNTSEIFQQIQQLQMSTWPRSRRAIYNADLEHEQKLSRGPCTPGTRISVLKYIYKWAQDTSLESSCVFWLTGPAGSGKSTIAYSVAQHFGDGAEGIPNILQATFFASRQYDDTRQRRLIIPSLVYQLAYHSKSYAHALLQANRFDSVDIASKQMNDLLVDPWAKSAYRRSSDLLPCLIIIDALDEIDNKGGLDFLQDLLKAVNTGNLKGLKFLVTSRPDPYLAKLCKSFTSDAICHLYDVAKEEVDRDISLYLRAKLTWLQDRHDDITSLLKQADSLFIYATTAVKFISYPFGSTKKEQIARLSKLIEYNNTSISIKASQIDSLYQQILFEAFSDFESEALIARIKILHTILCAKEPLSLAVVAALLNPSDEEDTIEQARYIVERLYAVLYVKDDSVFWYHASFQDFIFSQDRFWSQHMIKSMPHKHKDIVTHILELLDLKHTNNNLHVVKAIQEAANFAVYFTATDAVWSTPHLYISSLATWSEESNIVQKWKQHFSGLALLTGSKLITPLIRIDQDFEIETVVFSPDGMHIAIGSNDHSVRVWNSSTGKQIQQLQGHADQINSIAFSTDGTQIVSGSHDKSVIIWNILTGKQIQKLQGHTDWVNSVAFSYDGTQIVSGSYDKSVRVWDILNGKEVQHLKGHTDSVKSVAFSSDKTQIVSGSHDKSVRIWDASSGQEVKRLQGHTNWINSVAFSADALQIVSGSRDKSVRVWDALTGKEMQQLLGHTNSVTSVAFSPDAAQIVSGSHDKSIRIWNALTGQKIQHLQGHNDWVTSVAFSFDGTQIVSGSHDKSVRVWDSSVGKKVLPLQGHTDWVRCVAFSPDGTQIVSGAYDKSVRVWDSFNGNQIQQLRGHTNWVSSVAFSPDGTQVISGSCDKSVKIWDILTGQEVQQLKGHTHWVNSVAFSPNSIQVVSGSHDNSVKVWNVSTGQESFHMEAHKNAVKSVAFSPNGTQIVSGSYDKTVYIWDALTGKAIQQMQGHTNWVKCVAFSPDGTQIVSGSYDKSVKVWNVLTGKQIQELQGHTDWVNSVAFSPDGTQIVSASHDKSVRIWDALTGQEIQHLQGHTAWVSCVAFSPDGTRIVSGSGDKS
ncbi:hypothetical protein H0H92_003195, partial [Tricholoma furcatifolium]